MEPDAPLPRLHLVTDTALLARDGFVREAASVIAAAGVRAPVALHLRGEVETPRLTELADALLPITRAAGALLFVNDRVDVAAVTRADGVHLPQAGMAPTEARKVLGHPAWIGVSVHDEEEAEAAHRAHYLAFGNVWETASHPGRPAAGLDALAKVVAGVTQPVLAVGGVTPDRVADAVEAGAHGVAVLSGIWSDASPPEAVIRYLDALDVAPAATA